MLWLQTFGGPIVFDDEGQPKLAAAQRRSLGLLSVLAVAGSGGLSRDKIVGLLWPDVSAKRARHSLTQALYAARKSLDCDYLVEGIEDLRLDPHGIQTDLAAFEAAMQQGDDEAAARLYRGPFLDGFFPPTPVFERWLDAQRAGFEERAVGVLKRLADRAVLAADHAKAVEWLRELTAIRPGNSAITVQLMQALAASGDTHAALQRAQLYTKIRRDDFELDADPAVVEFAEGLRKSAPRVLIPDPPEPASEVFHLSAATSTTTGGAPVTDPDPQAGAIVLKTELTGYRRRAQSRRRGFAVSATLLAAMAYLFFNRPTSPTLPVFSSSILVAPFRVVSEDPALAYLREGMVELLSTHLADDSAAPAVDAGAVLQAWRRAGLSGRSPEPIRDTVVSVAARLGAERVIVGSIVGTQKRAVVRATIVQAASGKVDGEGQVEGPIDSLTNMVDRLAAQLLAVQAGLPTSLTERTTKAVPALRAYLFGAAAYSIGDFAIAANRFERALQVDSTFAIAALRLGLTARQLNHDRLERHALALAWRHRNALTQRDSAHLTALIGPRYPEPSSEAESLIAWEAAIRALPARPEVLYGYAAFLAERSGYQLAEPQRERALAALDRALALDSVFVLAHQLRLELADSVVDLPPATPFLRWRLAVTRADTATLARLADSLSAMGPANLRALVAAAQFDGIQLEAGTRAVTVLRNRTPAADDAMDYLLAAYSFATLARDTAASSDIIRAMQRASPVTHMHLRLRVLDALYSEADSVGAAEAARELERAVAAGESNDPAADACVVGQWQIAGSDTSGYRVVLNTLQSAPPTSGQHIGTAAAVCAPLLTAQYAVNTAQPNARDLVQSLDTLVMTSPAAGDAAVYAHIALARLHRQLGNLMPALQAIRRRPYLAGGWPRYQATAHLEEGLLAQQAGDLPGAVAALTRYLAVRTAAADPRVPVVQATRDSLMLLVSPAAAQQGIPDLSTFLQREIGLTPAELKTAATQPVTKVVTMAGGRDIGVFGMVAVAAPRTFLVSQIKDFTQYLRIPTRTRFGVFDAPATSANVQAVQVTAEDIKELRSCKPGDCSFKLPASEMKELRAKSTGADAVATAAVTAYVRQRMLDLAGDYRTRGDAAMLVYDDRGGVESSRALRELAATPRYLYQYVPELQQYLDNYPRTKLEGATDVLFWARDEMPSLRPMLNITHMTVYSPPALPQMTLVTSKSIYANHYFEAALDVLAIADRPDAPGTSYVLYLRRYRFDNLTAGIVNLRGRVTNAMRGLTTTDLQRFKATYEARYNQSR